MNLVDLPKSALLRLAKPRAGFWAAIFLLLIAYNPAVAKDKNIPRAEEGYADSALVDGKQNYPFELYGVSRDWNAQCRKGNTAQCIRLAKAFEEGLGALAKDNRVAIGY